MNAKYERSFIWNLHYSFTLVGRTLFNLGCYFGGKMLEGCGDREFVREESNRKLVFVVIKWWVQDPIYWGCKWPTNGDLWREKIFGLSRTYIKSNSSCSLMNVDSYMYCINKSILRAYNHTNCLQTILKVSLTKTSPWDFWSRSSKPLSFLNLPFRSALVKMSTNRCSP